MMKKLCRLFFNSNVFPFILAFAVLGVLFVLFRMKGVEINYKLASVDKSTERAMLENKELNARRATQLSIGKLRRFARKYKLRQPKQEQIIIIP